MGSPRFATTKDLVASFPSAAIYLREEGSSEDSLRYVERRVAENRLDLALTYCAFLLPRREAVWWGCQCLADVDALNETERDCLRLARDWAQRPDEARRRLALEQGLGSSKSLSGTWIALAAGRSGGNIAPADAEPVAADPAATAEAVRAALLSGSTRVAREKRDAIMKRWVTLAVSHIESAVEFR
ncbi:hypothetical protein K9U39_07815 [Rhodoblastus acidophilus]|uniref:Uncharacterized protein n=1 Tax=Candidatus Rhodoblastus alkanivorans TaxID=2954117 RepID=A0ABS9Z910_9HYPH|nr:hypothetical protein [Candidatus Rhodoblastus alkanivorans]MCI4678278.1 hypothetical protein [Candidatus Rhodoblastus alkanivorans]MCI4683536.1 hypothetical protein [Candidatus Rhodoblastus alkanivorans]MDI4640851.1 hypothetical protein [Rhodoblastus acidophilus]